MGPLGSVSLIVAAAVVALLINLTGIATPDGGPGERRALERQQTSATPPSARWWDEEWRRAFRETASEPRASLAETLLAVASGDLLPAVPGENVVEEVKSLARDGVTTGIDSVSAVGPLGSPQFPGEDDVLHGAPGPGGATPASPPPSSPSGPTPSEPTPTDPAPSDPTPTDPAPTDPAPSDPPTSDPEPSDPPPSDPPTSDPEPNDPPPSDPPTSDPEPSDPPPSDPPTSDPEPSDPPPSDPTVAPTDPTPTDPAP